MIYLLGGAPRTGKSLFAANANRDRGVSLISTDLLRCVLMKADDGLREAMEAHDRQAEADAFHPHLRQAVACARIQLSDALIEGIGFFPRHVDLLRRELEIEDLHACFVGRSAATPEELFGHATDHRVYDALDRERQEAFAAKVVEWSALYARECEETGLAYVDFAKAGFSDSLRAVEAALFGAGSGDSESAGRG